MNKICNKCKADKNANEYYKDQNKSDGLSTLCKECIKQKLKAQRQTLHYKEQKKIREAALHYKEQKREYGKTYYQTEGYKEKRKARAQTSEYKEKRKEYLKKYKESGALAKANQKYKESGRLAEAQKHSREKRKNNPQSKLDHAIGTALWKSLKESKGGRSWEELVGYSLEQLVAHLEPLLKEGMTWDNYGTYWHVDHIKPKSWFAYETPADDAFRLCWGLDNLQPLSAVDNIKKGNRHSG
jgi:hypothetical protein